eukprot:TRINITY_DN127_c0_g3_i1.p1 TRINITY_DN127_c0_g3~~TRINITY_DN127_c0_g3_i1.p1  ORF type:complete len:220 (+),score=59.68 TRINITY_DN127_c0_g3_i1:73-732(+)
MALKLVYFPLPGRAEPIRLALTLGGVEFKDERLTGEQWGTSLKGEVAPKQMPLLYVGDKVIGQSLALLRYAGKVSKFEGKPLYPECPELALEVDEFVDFVCELFPPLGASFKIADQAEKEAFRAKLVAEGGDMHKWLSYLDTLMGKSKTGFAVGDYITVADIALFCFVLPLKSGWLDGMPTTCLDGFKNLAAHKAKLSAIPEIKAYYAEPKSPLYKAFQ